MASRLNPYISFRHNAREALEFYRSVLGGEVHIMTFGEMGDADSPIADDVMHGQLETPAGFTLMCSDTPDEMPYDPGNNIAVSISGDDAEQLRGYFAALSEGGVVTVPLETQMWGDEFGMLIDRFGVGWLVNIAQS